MKKHSGYAVKEKRHKRFGCQPEISRVASTVIGILWEASEGRWDEARESVEYRLRPAVERLERCLGKRLSYTESMIQEKIAERIDRQDLDSLMSGSKTFIANFLAEALRGLPGFE